MEFRSLTEQLAVSGQITPAGIADAARAGFRSVICNRPDGEAPDQPGHTEVAAAAQEAGLNFAYIPVVPGSACVDEAEAFARAMDELPGPVLAYCRSGARSATLAGLAGRDGAARAAG